MAGRVRTQPGVRRYRMAIWERDRGQGVGGYRCVQNESCAWERGRFEDTRKVRNGWLQVHYYHPGSDVWVWAVAMAMTWSMTLRKAERIGLDRVGSVPHWLKHSGKRALHFTLAVQ